MARPFNPGDWIVYRKTKHSSHPGPRATNVTPAKSGDLYGYTVDKFWIVRRVNPDGQVVLETRTGKQHTVPADDPALRKASWWHRLRYRARFLAIAQHLAQQPDSSSSSS